ncbi:MAG TPA: radical SAM protein [Candidatus Acidoferrales bacterium]|nr:radical SAM protein [Candidatus Acidoferrales bacterium]
MADGTTKCLEDVRIGDRIYGTVRRGAYRRYVQTFVLSHWSVEKLAYRITLEDGTQIVASGDHRFLTDRGWKFVIDAEHGETMRPHLTTNNKLMGTGAFASPPQKDINYKRGYLCGLVRGDGLLGVYQYRREGGAHGYSYQFRLALTDREALQRAQEYLLYFAIPTRNFIFHEATANAREMHAIRTQTRSYVEDIEKIVVWPSQPSREWCAGFLSGIFDAEGGYRRGILRISNTNPIIVNFTASCLTRLGIPFVTEFRTNTGVKPIKVLRIRGGLREHLRFFHAVDPAITRKRDIEGQAVKNTSRLRVSAIEPLGTRQLFDITTGTGDFIANGVISHNCYARRTHWFLDEDGINEWASKIFVKVNAPEVLRRELARRSWKHEEVALGTATDPYQAIEGKYKITRRILEALCEYRTPVSIVTRSPMIVRDIDILTKLAKHAGVTVCVSVATTDPSIASEIEPTVAPPAQRLRAVETLSSHGIRTGVLLAPILPGITDPPKSLEAVVEAAQEHKAHFVWHNVLHLGDVTRETFIRYLGENRPDLLPMYGQMYRGKYAPQAYRARISQVVAGHKARHQIVEPRYIEPPPEPEQMSLLASPEPRV